MRHALAVLLLLPALAGAQTIIVYSRQDAAAAHRAHALASVYGPAVIDRQLPPGVQWRPTIAGVICGARMVLLIWSQHAAASAEVRRELDTALICGTEIQPVLLDSTPLPGVVGDVQAVDWR